MQYHLTPKLHGITHPAWRTPHKRPLVNDPSGVRGHDYHSEYICAIWLPTRFSLVAAKARFAAHEDNMLEGVGDKSALSTYLFLRFGSILSNNFAATRNRA